jgi:hypothetical protein
MVASPASHSPEEARISYRGWSKDGGKFTNRQTLVATG